MAETAMAWSRSESVNFAPGGAAVAFGCLRSDAMMAVFGLESSNLGVDLGLSLFSGQLDLSELLGFSSVLLLGELLLSWLERWVSSDGFVSFGVDVFDGIGIDVISQVTLEDFSELLFIVISQFFHVFGNVTTEDVLSQQLGVQFLSFDIPTWESVWRVWDEQSTVRGTLQSTKDSGTSGGSAQTNVQEDLEWSWSVFDSLGQFEFTFNFFDTSVGLVQVQLLQDSSGNQQTNGVGSRPVGQTVLDTVSWQFMGVGSSQNKVTGDGRGDDAGNDVLVGESDNQSVLWRSVLGLVLSDQSLSAVVVGLTFSSSSERSAVTR